MGNTLDREEKLCNKRNSSKLDSLLLGAATYMHHLEVPGFTFMQNIF